MSHDHTSEPEFTGTLHTRRQFLRTSMLGAAASWTLPLFLEKTFGAMDAAAADSLIQTATGRDHPILVVIQLAGGNDGLNTVVPYTDDIYHRSRPRLAVAADKILRIDEHVGLNPALGPLKSLYDDGALGIIQGVGYPNPNRSHFRSTEIWQTAVDADRVQNTGWLGRYFDNYCQGEDASVGVSMAGDIPQAFAAPVPRGIGFARPEDYRWVNDEPPQGSASVSEFFFRQLNQPDAIDGEEMSGASISGLTGPAMDELGPMDFLQRTALDAQLSSDKVLEIARKFKPAVSYPNSRLAAGLSLVGRMIAGGLPTRVYYVSQGGYDTHANQAGSHERLLGELAEAMEAFRRDMVAQGNFSRVLMMTFSEFGRRVSENANRGTDHGAAAPMFIMGGKVNAGLHGTRPDLGKLDRGDLVHSVDFRNVYSGVLEKWLGVKSAPVLGREFKPFPVV